MLTLASGEKIWGISLVTTDVITYTLHGDEVGTSDAFRTIAQGVLTTSAVTLYTVPGSTQTLIKAISLVNTSVSDVVGIIFYIGSSAVSSTQITGTMTIPANGTATYANGVWNIYSASGVILATIGGAAGGHLTGSYPNPTIAQGVVTNAKLTDMATQTLKGRNTAGTGTPEDLSVTTATAMLNVATTSLKGLLSAVDKIRLNSIQYDFVADFGGVGDDSTMNDTAFSNAISNMATGGVLNIPAGTYKISAAINISVDKRFTFRGVNRYASIIKTTDATQHTFTKSVAGWYDMWTDIGFQTSVTKTAGAAINIPNGNNVGMNIYRCAFTGMFHSINATGAQSANLSVWSDLDISSVPNGGRGIVINGSTINVMIHNATINAGSATTSACVEIRQSGAVQVTACDWIQGTNVLLIDSSEASGAGPQACYFTNCFFDQPQGSVIKIIGTRTANRIKFTECGIAPTGNNHAVEIAGTGSGGVGTSTALPAGISIVDCDIYSANGTNTGNGVFLNGVGDVNIQNSRITGFAGAGGCAVRCTPSASNQTKLRVNGCILGPNSNLTVTNTIGVQLDAGSSALGFLSVTDNSMIGSTTAIVDNSTVLNTTAKNINNNQGAMSGFSAQAVPLSTFLTTAETVIMVVPLQPNAVKVGTTFQVILSYRPGAASVITLGARIGTSDTTPATDTCVQTIADASSANGRMATAQFAITAIGGSATFIGNGTINTSGVAQAVTTAAPATSGTFNSAVQNYFMVTLKSTTTNTGIVHSGSVIINSPA